MAAHNLIILTWNILEGGSNDRLDEILRLIKAQKPDVVALQECNGWHTDGEKILRYAQRELGMQSFPFWNSGGYQPVILTRLEGAYAVRHDHQGPCLQGFQEVVLPLPGGRNWHFFNTHLYAFSENVRLSEVETISRAMKPHRLGLCSLTGDFNSLEPGCSYGGVRIGTRTRIRLDDHPLLRARFDAHGLPGLYGYGDAVDPHAWLRLPYRQRRLVQFAELRTDVYRHLARAGWIDGFLRTRSTASGLTFPSTRPELRIDFAWLSRLLAKRLVACDVLTGPRFARASDHLPLRWEVEVS
jgi:endonuclease/exonuclease/phosphatase family metal-dependent hydrolase